MAPTPAPGERMVVTLPEVAVISNIVVSGKAVGSLGNSELVWHQDMSYNELPPKASLLYGIETPSAGGETFFYNLYDAYATLPQPLKHRRNQLDPSLRRLMHRTQVRDKARPEPTQRV